MSNRSQRLSLLRSRVNDLSEGIRKFDENEPRDDHGRWTDGGGGGSAAPLSRPTGFPVGGFYALDHAGNPIKKPDAKYGDLPPRYTTQEKADAVATAHRGASGKSPFEFTRMESVGPRGTKWTLTHKPSGKSVGDLAFRSRNEATAFINEHLQPDHPDWQKSNMTDHTAQLYSAARAKLYNIR